MWAVTACMYAVQTLCWMFHPPRRLSLEMAGNVDRERRHFIMWWPWRLSKHSARMYLASYLGTCGSEVRPQLEPTYNDHKERGQDTKIGNEDRAQKQGRTQGKKSGNENREPRQGTKTGNEDREPILKNKTKNQDYEPKLRTKNRE